MYDGHGGREVARFCALRLHSTLLATPAFGRGDVEGALVASFFGVDEQIRTEAGRKALASLADGAPPASDEGGAERAAAEAAMEAEEGEEAGRGPTAGCTACVALIQGGVLYVANAGDSRAVLCRAGGAAEDMSVDHKPTLEREKARIIAAGGFVADGRVKGSLALSRAIGDMEFKQSPGLGPEAQMVTALPDVRREPLRSTDEFLLIACDGIWDVMSSSGAVEFVRGRLAGGAMPVDAAASLCDACMAPDTRGNGLGCDNMSVVIVQLLAAQGARGTGATAAAGGASAVAEPK